VKKWVAWVGGVAVLVAGSVALLRGDGQGSAENTARSTSLLLSTADWGGALDVSEGPLVVETRTLHGVLPPKAVSVQRRWSVDGRSFSLRQEVQVQVSTGKAKDAFREVDPGSDLHDHLGPIRSLSIAAARHADEGVGYCVPAPVGCDLIEYALRYGDYVVDLGLREHDETAVDGEMFLEQLDFVVSGRLR
jgi:hypothetical protein